MKVAAYQAPLLAPGSMDAVSLIQRQLVRCEAEGIEILCCPETVLGGPADDVDPPSSVALRVEDGELASVLAPLASSSVTLILGFTERGPSNTLFNSAAIIERGQVLGIYRKAYPGNRTVYAPGEHLPIFSHRSATLGIIICNDANYLEPARVLAARGAALLFLPLNNALRPEVAEHSRTRTRSNLIARAVENNLTVIAADVAGRHNGLVSFGGSAIVDQDGTVLAASAPFIEDLVTAEVRTQRPPPGRGWDGSKNPAVVRAFLGLWRVDDT